MGTTIKNEYGLNLDWFTEDEDGFNSFDDLAKQRLLASVGFTVKLERTGWEAEDLLLVTTQISEYLGGATVVDPAALAAEAAGDADERLRNALAVLGLTPLQEKPAWLLTAFRL